MSILRGFQLWHKEYVIACNFLRGANFIKNVRRKDFLKSRVIDIWVENVTEVRTVVVIP